MSVELYRESPGKFDSRTLNRKTLNRWIGRIILLLLQWGLHLADLVRDGVADLCMYDNKNNNNNNNNNIVTCVYNMCVYNNNNYTHICIYIYIYIYIHI